MSAPAAIEKGLTLRPEPGEWGRRLRAGPAAPDAARRLREQLALPTDRPIILTGHQAEFWHAGILAKYLAADAAASAFDAAAAWVVVDQDTSDAGAIRYPARRADGRFITAVWEVDPAAPMLPDTPAAMRPPLRVGDLDLADAPPASASVREGLGRIAEALRRHAAEPSLARQVAAAIRDLLAPLISPAPTIFATDLARTDLFADWVRRMRDDPHGCVRAYNEAARRHPGAGVRPLHADEVNERYELPLWRLAPGQHRRRVYAEDLDAIPIAELAPRALLLTGLLRAGAGDLFIHGTGGGGDEAHEGYDAITDDWLRRWLGLEPLAPVVVATATRRLDLGAEPPQPAQVARALWRAHHARHDPAMLGDAPAAARKRQLVERVRELKRAGDPAPAFRELHALLESVRSRHAEALARLEHEASALRARLADAAVLTDRTWPFPLHPPETLAALRDEVRHAFNA